MACLVSGHMTLAPCRAQLPPEHGLAATLLLFTGQEMQEAYGSALGLEYLYREDLGGHFEYSVGAGLLIATGNPAINPETIFDVYSSSLHLLSFPLTFSVLRSVPFFPDSGLRPYVGLGGGGQIGLEVLQAELADVLYMTDWLETSFRTAWSGHVVVGAELSGLNHEPFWEFIWVLGGRSSDRDGLSGDRKAQAADGLYDAVSRPDGRSTGWQFRLGMKF